MDGDTEEYWEAARTLPEPNFNIDLPPIKRKKTISLAQRKKWLALIES